MSAQNVARPRGNRKTLIIGFDFGTHSTKVVFRERGTAKGGYISAFDEFAAGYPPCASPSVVRQVGDQLYFGTAALRKPGGTLFRSLKVTLLTGSKNRVQFSGELDNSTLVAAYLAWAFQQVRNFLREYGDASVFLNVAAPMSHFEDPHLKNRYLQIVQAAWSLSFGDQPRPIRQGVRVRDVAAIMSPLLAAPVQSSEYRRFDVLPETIAPVVSLSLDEWMAPGMYVIVDTGAGTTEMSVFHAGEPDADQKVLCYQDETMLVGGNDLQLAEQSAENDRLSEINKITCKLKKRYRRIWHLGYQLDAPNHVARARWKELTLVLSGGGTRHHAVATQLAGVNPMCPWPENETTLRVCRHVPGTLELDADMDEDDGSLFAVANGLAIERKHWPVVFKPNQIEQLAPTEEVANKPQAYWYVDAK